MIQKTSEVMQFRANATAPSEDKYNIG